MTPWFLPHHHYTLRPLPWWLFWLPFLSIDATIFKFVLLALHHHHHHTRHTSSSSITTKGHRGGLALRPGENRLGRESKGKMVKTVNCSFCVTYFVKTPIEKGSTWNSQAWKFAQSWTITGEKCKISIAWPHFLTFCSSLPCRQGHPCAAQVFILVMIIYQPALIGDPSHRVEALS